MGVTGCTVGLDYQTYTAILGEQLQFTMAGLVVGMSADFREGVHVQGRAFLLAG